MKKLLPAIAMLALAALALLECGERDSMPDLAIPADPVEADESENQPDALAVVEHTGRTEHFWKLSDFGGLEPGADNAAFGLPPEPGFALGALLGRLVWSDSWKPLESARVRLSGARLDTVVPITERRDGALMHVAEGVTDTRGDFRIENVPVHEELYLVIDHPEAHVLHKLRWAPQTGEVVELGVIAIDPTGSVRGRVVDEQGEPVEGVRVRGIDQAMPAGDAAAERERELALEGAERIHARGTLYGRAIPQWMRIRDRLLPFPEFETGPGGRFELRGLRAGDVELAMRDTTRLGGRASVLVAPWRETDVGDVRLVSGRPFSVEVLDQERVGISGVRVSVRPGEWKFGSEPVETDASGVATTRIPEDCRVVAVSLMRKGSTLWEPRGQHHARHRVTLIMRGRGSITLHCRTLADAPVFESSVAVVPRGAARAIAETPSRWRFAGLLPGVRATYVAVAPGFAPAVGMIGGKREIRFVPAVSSTFVVLGDGGVPIENARVEAIPLPCHIYDHPGSQWQLLPEPLLLGRTDENGRLVARGLWPSEMKFRLRHPELGTIITDKMIPMDGRVIDVWFLPPPRVRGFLTLPGKRPPQKRWRVVANPLNAAGGEVSTLAELDGAFELTGLTAGYWRVSVSRPKPPISAAFAAQRHVASVASVEFHLAAGHTHYVDLQIGSLPRAATACTGTARIDGQPAKDALVRLEVTRRDPKKFHGFAPRWRKKMVEHNVKTLDARIDETGVFAFHKLPNRFHAARAVLRLRREGRWCEFAAVDLDPESKNRSIEFEVATGEFELAMYDENGRPLAGRPVTIARTDVETLRFEVVADSIGYVRFSGGVPAGRYRVEVPGLRLREPEFDVIAGGRAIREVYAIERVR